MTDTIMMSRWVSPDGEHWIELHKHLDGGGNVVRFSYKADQCSRAWEWVSQAVIDEMAILVMQVAQNPDNLDMSVPDIGDMSLERITR